eukprot:GHVR01104394.1.p2 GENE.GHVR01104394.1~~GHVR01104394.1.p2  ORF type:complete len:100 (-),score=1.45 GHVR01104394.1:401-700(-)
MVKSKNGLPPAGQTHTPTPSQSLGMPFGTTNQVNALMPWCVLTEKNETFQSWPIPTGEGDAQIFAGIVRHMRPTRDGNLLIHQSATNRIILVKPEAQKN